MADMVIFARSAKVLLANTDFAKDFYQVLCNKESNNFIFSPISVHSILSLTYQGAAGSTAESFANTLRLENATVARDGYKSIIESLNNVEDITLYTANKIYVKTNYRLNATFNEIARYSFYSEIEQIDFEDNENAANTINVWVEKTTKEKIKNLISANDLNSRTRMILINAIYFKGNWRHKFNPLKTKKQPFYVNQNQVMYVDMMHTKERFRYSRIRNLDANILLLPYKNSDFSMLIILPNERNGIGYLESKLASVDIAGMVSNMQYSEVNVALPKFRIESTLMLNNILEELGLGIIFTNAADFSGLLDSPEALVVTKVIQKAFIEVNEEGAEAAAATAVEFACYSYCESRDIPKDFIVDHPFVFLLIVQKKRCLNVLFKGRVLSPKN